MSDHLRAERTLSHEVGHSVGGFNQESDILELYPEGQGTEIELFDGYTECIDIATSTDQNDPEELTDRT